MSLINQVLRDLDARHAATEQKTLPNEVRPLPAAGKPQPPAAMMVAIVLLPALAVGAWWWWWDSESAPEMAMPAVASARASAVPAVPEALSPPALVIAPPELPVESVEPGSGVPTAPTVAALRLDTQLTIPSPAPVAPATVSAPAPAAAVVAADMTPVRIDKQVRVGVAEQAEAAYRKASAEHRAGLDDEAIAHLHEALALAPNHSNARQLLLSVLVERRSWPQAETALRDGLAVTPGHAPWAMALARIQVERGDLEQAWRTLQQYRAAGAGNADYQGFAGVLLQRLKKPEEAAAYYEAALRLRPEGRWWVGLGLALEAAGRSAEAREAFVQARELGGLTPEADTVVAQRLK